MLGDVSDPQPVRGVDGELPVDQVGAGLGVRVAHRAAVPSAPVEALDPGLAHQPGDPLEVHRQTQPEGQLGVHPRGSIGASRLGMNVSDVLEQQCVLLTSWRVEPGYPFVVARPRHVQHPAGHRDIDVVVGEFTDQRED